VRLEINPQWNFGQIGFPAAADDEFEALGERHGVTER